MSLAGVIGVAVGQTDGRPCIRVLVARVTPGLSTAIPESLEGHPIDVLETGEIQALDS